MIFSDTEGQAEKFLFEIKEQLELNPAIKEHYPQAHGRGLVWKTDEIETRNGVRIEAYGKGNAIRGVRRSEARPTKIILDDVQNNKDIASEKRRINAWDWLTMEVIPAGSEDTNFVSVGTALHRDCIAVKLIETPRWEGKRFQAIMNWPDRADLWDKWESLLTNLGDPKRNDTAHEFYRCNQADMEKGARVLWPSYKNLLALMLARAERGPKAFDTEYQAITSAGGVCEWGEEYFNHDTMYFNEWPSMLEHKGYALDPSKGKTDKPGDFQAHVWGGTNPRDGKIYVDADFQREAANAMLGRTVQIVEQFNGVEELIAETNIFGSLLDTEIQRIAKERGINRPKFHGIDNTDPKPIRIRQLDAFLARKQIRVRNTRGGRELVHQLSNLFTGLHDDGPDALEMLMRRIDLKMRSSIAKAKKTQTPQAETRERWRTSQIGFDPRRGDY